MIHAVPTGSVREGLLERWQFEVLGPAAYCAMKGIKSGHVAADGSVAN